MRVTNYISNQQFLTNNNMMLTRQIKSNNRIATQRRFDRVSEDIVNGSKAMTIRRELRDISIYNDNLSSAKSLFYEAETNLTFIAHNEYISVEERLVAAANGTHEQMDLDIYATQLEEIAEQMVTTLNGDISERQLFGGASNGTTPFQIQRVVIKDEGGSVVYPPDYNKYYNADGSIKDGVEIDDIPRKVTYNGVPLDFDVTSDLILPDGTLSTPTAQNYQIFVLEENENAKGYKTFKEGDPKTVDAADVQHAIDNKDNSLMFPGSKPIYVDIGLGIKYDDDYNVDPQTALDVSMNGAEITGCGVDISGIEMTTSTNIIPTRIEATLNDADILRLQNGKAGTSWDFDIEVDGTLMGPYGGGYLDTSAALPTKTDGSVYTDAEITAGLNKSLADQYYAQTGKELPSDVVITYSDGKITIDADETPLAFDTSLGASIANTENNVVQNDVEVEVETVELDDEGIPDLSEYYSKNLMQLVLDSAAALRRGDQSYVNAVIDRANEANNHILIEITTLGTKQNSIEFYQSKNEDYDYNLKERQNIVEGTDMENEIIEYEGVKSAYEAVLKMSSTILGNSIFDFI